jgi:hypothetical protein
MQRINSSASSLESLVKLFALQYGIKPSRVRAREGGGGERETRASEAVWSLEIRVTAGRLFVPAPERRHVIRCRC